MSGKTMPDGVTGVRRKEVTEDMLIEKIKKRTYIGEKLLKCEKDVESMDQNRVYCYTVRAIYPHGVLTDRDSTRSNYRPRRFMTWGEVSALRRMKGMSDTDYFVRKLGEAVEEDME